MGGYIFCSLPLALFVEGNVALSTSVNLLNSNVNRSRQPSAFFDNLGNIIETTGQPATFLGNFTTHQHQVFVGWKTFKNDILRIRRKKSTNTDMQIFIQTNLSPKNWEKCRDRQKKIAASSSICQNWIKKLILMVKCYQFYEFDVVKTLR